MLLLKERWEWSDTKRGRTVWRRFRRRWPSSSSCACPPSSSDMWCTWQNVPVWCSSESLTELRPPCSELPRELSDELSSSLPCAESLLPVLLLVLARGHAGDDDSEPSGL